MRFKLRTFLIVAFLACLLAYWVDLGNAIKNWWNTPTVGPTSAPTSTSGKSATKTFPITKSVRPGSNNALPKSSNQLFNPDKLQRKFPSEIEEGMQIDALQMQDRLQRSR